MVRVDEVSEKQKEVNELSNVPRGAFYKEAAVLAVKIQENFEELV